MPKRLKIADSVRPKEAATGPIFLSYRRDDVGQFARTLADALSRALGESKVFLDLDKLRVGDEWEKRIEDALRRATLVLAVIGPRWLHLQDIHGQRRLDKPDDWVRGEVEFALRHGVPILPVLVDGAVPPAREALPRALNGLTRFQAYSFAAQYFKRDFPDLLKQLREFGFSPVNVADVLPAPLDRSPALRTQELRKALEDLPNWQVVDSRPLPDGNGAKVELFRHYVFRSFADAMHFMATASRYADKTDHHPEWLNLWVNLKVWLTTWDIGFKPTYKDVRHAQYLEDLFKHYATGDEQVGQTEGVLPAKGKAPKRRR